MYIEKGKPNEIPSDAIRLTSDEVMKYMKDLVHKWPKLSDVWALKYGNPILSSAVVISNTLILNFYRKKLKLRNYGRFTLFIPIVFCSSIVDQVFQNSLVTRSIILQDECPTCTTSRSLTIQLGTGIIYPVFASIAGTYLFGSKMGTVNFKSADHIMKIQEFLSHVTHTSRPFYNRLALFSISHVILSYAICYFQMKSYEFLRFKMLKQSIEEAEIVHKNSK